MTKTDRAGLPVTGANDESLAAFEQAAHELRCLVDDPMATIDRAIAASPARGEGLGRALALAAMHALAAQGYVYGIVGGVGPAAFYEKLFGAIAIPGSTPGLYAGMLRGATG